MKRHLFRITAVILTFTLGVSLHHNRGRIEAYFDLFQGKHIIKMWGRFAEEKDKYNAVFREYGVEMVPVGLCSVTEDLQDEIVQYNSVSLTAIEAKYGRSMWDRLSQQYGKLNPAEEKKKNAEFVRRCGLANRMRLAE
jgi:hypothetical protein